MSLLIPKEIKEIIQTLKKTGFAGYIVGGCVRDILRGVEPNDWDITTNAPPEKIQALFKRSFLDNKFGTVTVLTNSKIDSLKEVEITPFRKESGYSDRRHPDKVVWAKTIEEDLSRRDFTVNAMAIDIENNLKVIDPFNGMADLKSKTIKAVGSPEKRFQEDALRLMRAVRFAVTLDKNKLWQIEEKTGLAIQKNAPLLADISKERIRDEFVKIIMSRNGARGVEILRRFGLLKFIIPELEEGFGIEQNKHHIYQVYQHNLLSLNYACEKNYSLVVRLAALLHDIAKPRTKQGEGPEATFYNHEVVGERMTKNILRRLRFSSQDIKKVSLLVRYHLFYYNVDEVTPSSVRRLLRKVGLENIDDLLKVRYCDRIGSGVPKAEPYKLRHLRYVIEKVSQDPLSPKMLKISGEDVMRIMNISPGPKVGQVLTILLWQVLDKPSINNQRRLYEEVEKLKKLSDKELKEKFFESRRKINEIETKQDEMTKKKYWVM